MNEAKVTKNIEKKYGVPPSELSNMSISQIRNLKLHNSVTNKEKDKLKVVKRPIEVLTKGGSLGAGVAGAINTAFPNIVPTIAGALTATSDISPVEKAFSYITASSQITDAVTGPAIIEIGAAAGALVYGGYRLVKFGYDTCTMIHHRRVATKITEGENVKNTR